MREIDSIPKHSKKKVCSCLISSTYRSRPIAMCTGYLNDIPSSVNLQQGDQRMRIILLIFLIIGGIATKNCAFITVDKYNYLYVEEI